MPGNRVSHGLPLPQSFQPSVPETRGGGFGGRMEGCNAAQREAWLAAWEERLKLRERSLVEAGYPLSRSRATPVLNISCASCKHHLSPQGMQACYNNDASADTYTTDRRPNGIKLYDYNMEHNLCGCQVREFECGNCGQVVGHHIRFFCNGCSQSDNEGHRWHFDFQSVYAEPRQDTRTGEMLMWPGSEFSNQEDSSLDDVGGQIFDENSMVQPDTDIVDWSCSPLMDRNGRQRQASLGKPHAVSNNAAREATLAQREAALKTREDELLKREEAQFEADLSQGAREKSLRDATAQRENTDKELASRAAVLSQRLAMVETRERNLEEQMQQFLSDKANKDCKRAVERAEQKAAICGAEVDALRVQITEHKREARLANEKVASQSSEMQQLHEALAEARRDARLRGETGAQAMQLNGRGRLPLAEEAVQPPAKRTQELELEVASLRAALQQAKQCIQSKDDDLNFANRRLQAAQSVSQSKDIEIAAVNHQLQNAQSISQSKEVETAVENQRLHAADNVRGRDVEPERGVSRSTTTSITPDEFVQARLDVAEKLSKKRMDLDRREEALAARESALEAAARRQDMAPAVGQVHVPPYYSVGSSGGSGIPQPGGGGLAGLIKRITG